MKCQTIIDPETKIALEGDALVAALRNLDPTRCGYELHEDDVFCPSCGKKVLGNPEKFQDNLKAAEIRNSFFGER